MAKGKGGKRKGAAPRSFSPSTRSVRPKAQGVALGGAPRPNVPGEKKVTRRNWIADLFNTGPVVPKKPAEWQNTKARDNYHPTRLAAPAAKIEVRKQTPQKRNTQTKLTEPAPQSPKAREGKKTVCKARPKGHHPRRAGGGASKDFIPWCDRKK